MKKPFLILLLFLIPYSLVSAEAKTFVGIKNKEPLADPFVWAIHNGPQFPEKEVNTFGLVKRGYDGAQYRVVITVSEIYETVSVELVALMEDLVRKVIESYVVPLDEDTLSYKGPIKFKGWENYNTFSIELVGINENQIIKVIVLQNGRFDLIRSND